MEEIYSNNKSSTKQYYITLQMDTDFLSPGADVHTENPSREDRCGMNCMWKINEVISKIKLNESFMYWILVRIIYIIT